MSQDQGGVVAHTPFAVSRITTGEVPSTLSSESAAPYMSEESTGYSYPNPVRGLGLPILPSARSPRSPLRCNGYHQNGRESETTPP